ncbi:CpxP family protein [Vibrio cyclitrophicus]|uniref:CpxP family protein n=1 Tax=Vibrio cyclitrophicus TaxID=47951 RepID=UPI000C822B3B|nr:CpxP family protein [Vibrio cyclitrophicus]PME88037.1 stress adaptor protein CpxP [Vibrio cyclitrophicus]
MKMTKKLVLAAAALPLIFGTVSAYAYGGGDKSDHKGMHDKCGGFDKKVMRQLDLTDAQKEQLKEMREADRAEMKAKRGANKTAKMAQMKAHHEKVQALVLADNFDEAAANDLASQMVAKQTERRVAMLKKQHDMMSVLTAEQKTQLKEIQQERMSKCADKMEKRMNKDK